MVLSTIEQSGFLPVPIPTPAGGYVVRSVPYGQDQEFRPVINNRTEVPERVAVFAVKMNPATIALFGSFHSAVFFLSTIPSTTIASGDILSFWFVDIAGKKQQPLHHSFLHQH